MPTTLEPVSLPRAVKIWGRGQLTIPMDIRKELHVEENTIVSVFRIGGSIIVTPRVLRRASLARKVEKEMKKRKISLDDLMLSLQKERENYNRENYTT